MMLVSIENNNKKGSAQKTNGTYWGFLGNKEKIYKKVVRNICEVCSQL